MNMNIVETVVEVSRHKSFLDAAAALNYTPAVVSKQIARAEAELGFKLFFRGNKANAVTMTPECEAVIDELVKIRAGWQRVGNALEALKRSGDAASIRIGLGQRTWNYQEDEIIADFIQRNPDITTQLIHGYTADLLNSMTQGRIDGVFVAVLGRAEDLGSAVAFMRQNDCVFFKVIEMRKMYLAISEKHPLAAKSEADFSEFGDFTIAFNSDKLMMGSGWQPEPFRVLCEKYGMELKCSYLPTADASAYRIARDSNLAIPIPDNRMKFDGIHYIRLRDWTAPFTLYFVTMNRKKSPALLRFQRAVQAFRDKNEGQA